MERSKKIIDKLAWIEIRNKSILSTRSKGKDKFYIPGGKRDKGESDIEALVREIKEELSVELIRDSVEFVGNFEAQAHGHPEGVMVKMQCYNGNYQGKLKPDSEIEEMAWLKFKDLDKISHVDKLIFNWLKNKELIE